MTGVDVFGLLESPETSTDSFVVFEVEETNLTMWPAATCPADERPEEASHGFVTDSFGTGKSNLNYRQEHGGRFQRVSVYGNRQGFSSDSITDLLSPKTEQDDWFTRAMTLDRDGQSDEALDAIYAQVDEWLRAGKFTKCNSFMRRRQLEIENLPVRVILAIAILTRPASEKIPFREEFVERAWKTLEKRGKDARKLLGGLRGPTSQERPNVKT